MKIAVNTRLLLKGKLEGIGWFTYETLKRIVQQHPEHTFYFLFDRQYDESFIFGENVVPVVIGPQARHPILFNIWFDYSVTRVLKKIKADVFVSPDGYLSLRTKVPQLAVMHDLNFEHYPEDLPINIARYYKKRFPKFAQKATQIVTVSEFSKQDIIEQYGIAENKITVVPNGVGDHFQPLEKAEQRKIREQQTEGKPFFVYVGSLHARKNIERMLLAFDTFKKNTKAPHKFIVVGEKIWKSVDMSDFLDQLEYRNDVVFTGRLPLNELTKVVASSTAMVYVSYFEGFGIPVLEGMKSGVPVITSNITSMPEIAGDAAVPVDPFSVESIAEGMCSVLDEKECQRLIAKGNERAKQYSWNHSAEKLWKVIEIIS